MAGAGSTQIAYVNPPSQVNVPAYLRAQVCQNSCADGSVQAAEVYVQLSPKFSLSDLRVLVGCNHVEITEKVLCALHYTAH
jgi:hypothetical protein